MAGGLLSGLGNLLQYALPAAAGVALGGGPMGALAGAAEGAGDIQKAQREQSDLQERQAETALRWQQFGLEKQQAETAMQSEQSWKDYTDTLPKDQRAIALKDPQAYIQTALADQQWNLTKDTLKNHPEFAQSLGLDESAVQGFTQLPPSVGQPLLDSYIKNRQTGKFANGIHGPVSDDGGKTWYLEGVGPNGEITKIPTGSPASTTNIQLKQDEGPKPKLLTIYGSNGESKEVSAGDGYTPPPGWSLSKPPKAGSEQAKALSLLNTYKNLNGEPRLSSIRHGAAKEWHDNAVKALTAAGVPDDIAESTVSSVMPSPKSKSGDASAAPKQLNTLPSDARPVPNKPGLYYSKLKNKYYKET